MFNNFVNKAKQLIDSDEETPNRQEEPLPPLSPSPSPSPSPPPQEQPEPPPQDQPPTPKRWLRRKKQPQEPVEMRPIPPPPPHYHEPPLPPQEPSPEDHFTPPVTRKDRRRSSQAMPMRPKSRAVVLPSGFVISGSEDRCIL